ncbi:MAG: hypothetical protein E6I67_13395 [Chloroflexi bacterium]|nr:MAG: hypothetical protein E6I67_13395 [Chloroflexota bacterium]
MTVQAAKPTIATATHSTIAPADAAGCFCPSRKFSQLATSDATQNAPPATASQYGQPSAPGVSRTRSGSKARRRRSGPNDAPRNRRTPPIAMSRSAMPSANPL